MESTQQQLLYPPQEPGPPAYGPPEEMIQQHFGLPSTAHEQWGDFNKEYETDLLPHHGHTMAAFTDAMLSDDAEYSQFVLEEAKRLGYSKDKPPPGLLHMINAFMPVGDEHVVNPYQHFAMQDWLHEAQEGTENYLKHSLSEEGIQQRMDRMSQEREFKERFRTNPLPQIHSDLTVSSPKKHARQVIRNVQEARKAKNLDELPSEWSNISPEQLNQLASDGTYYEVLAAGFFNGWLTKKEEKEFKQLHHELGFDRPKQEIPTGLLTPPQ